MVVLKLILKQYNAGEITLNEMVNMINEFGVYSGYKSAFGKQTLKAYIKGELVEITIDK